MSDELERLIARVRDLRKLWATAGAPMFLGIPDSWMESPGPRFRCPSDHVSRFVIKSDEGDRCPACLKHVVMTFPTDVDGPFNVAMGQPPRIE